MLTLCVSFFWIYIGNNFINKMLFCFYERLNLGFLMIWKEKYGPQRRGSVWKMSII